MAEHSRELTPGQSAAATAADRHWLAEAIELSRRCPPSRSAFAVGAVIVAPDGAVLATGFSREGSPVDHAEEAALAKLGAVGGPPSGPPRAGPPAPCPAEGAAGPSEGAAGPSEGALPGRADARLAGATLYSSLEPCRYRASRPRPCAELIIAAGIRRVVIAWLEPPLFAPGGGGALLREAGVTVVEAPELAAAARAVNASVL